MINTRAAGDSRFARTGKEIIKTNNMVPLQQKLFTQM